MRALVISRQKFQAPMEVFPATMQAFAEWRERYRQNLESFYFFTAGGGGCGVVNAPDETVAQMFMEYPWGPYSEVELLPIVDGDAALARWQELLTHMAGGAAS
jgi:hypothetical protein